MIATVTWTLSSVAIATLIGAAALCAERVLTLRRGLPLRWVWMTAIGLSLGWSAWWLLPAPAATVTPTTVATEVVAPAPIFSPSSAQVSPVSATPELGVTSGTLRQWTVPAWTPLHWPTVSDRAARVVQVMWIGGSVAMLFALLWSSARLRRDRRHWYRASIAATDVLVSNGFGPAIVGLWRPSIVVPPWVLESDAATQRTILLHEHEHRRAGDQWLLLASFIAVVLAPWNVALWMMGRRLARTIELDCDERVLAHGVADVDYANVLLNAWQRTRQVVPWVPSPALAEHVSRLGRRVEHLMRPSPRGRAMKTIGGLGVSVLLLGSAVLVPRPQQAQPAAATTPAPTVQVPAVMVPPASVPAATAPASTVPVVTVPTVSAPSTTPTVARSPRATEPADRVLDDTMSATPFAAQPSRSAQAQRARIAVIMPFDAVGMPVTQVVHEQLVRDAEGHALHVISPQELKNYLQASGFSVTATLSPADVRALGKLVRADLVVSVALRCRVRSAASCLGEAGTIVVDASVASPLDSSLRRLERSEGTATQVGEQLVKALRTDSAYIRLRAPLPSVPVVAFRPAVFRPGSTGPAYPADLREAGVSGDVVARFVVDTTNRVDESTIAILASDRPQFAVSVIESLRAARFLSADRDGVKVRHTMQVAFQFDRRGGMTAVRIVTDDAAIRDIRQRFDARAAR
jgi:TonB family protein